MSEKQYVIFKLGSEEYGVDIMTVREITELKETTKIPDTPNFIEGVINLRGSVVPVINLKKRFTLEETTINKNSRIIIVTIGEKQIGFIVDDASQVMTLKEEDIENPPEIIAGVDRRYIVGIGKREEKIIILLDLIAVFSEDEKRKIENMKM
ncbi:purine-binding chemotaxis protein CheW [Geosporobacter subterraneus DSM 17957]|uniref:Chemotaxis protein CheW n=1 Tax=Geosporobacter subterraneus DSM 17957 TaxID=1121919 RepID=A0A1M6QMZ5_9FIRM|nr:chemotaxis protein CheW [Geosporobacter subterraneus]SHK21443.1 purine-binding chemotaxis protein CheW [Geosporobacter subterraneus DSM 17957]